MQMRTISIDVGGSGKAPRGHFVGLSGEYSKGDSIESGTAAAGAPESIHDAALKKLYPEEVLRALSETQKKALLQKMERERQERAREESRAQRHIVRDCCQVSKEVNHARPAWKPNFIWERNEFIMNAEMAKKKMGKKERLIAQRMKDVREIQFRNFIEDVFVKYDQGKFKDKIAWDLKFTQEEREAWVEKIFK